MLAVLLSCTLALSGCGREKTPDAHGGTIAMGTVFQFSLEGNTAASYTERLGHLATDLDRDLLSWREPAAQIARINASAGRPEGYPLTEETEALLLSCLAICQETEGAFDITLGALTKLWDLDAYASGEETERRAKDGSYVPPTPAQIREALTCCGYEKVRIADHHIYLPEGMSLDLGAVGKGYFLNRAQMEMTGELPDAYVRQILEEEKGFFGGSEDISGNDISGNDVSGNSVFKGYSFDVTGNDFTIFTPAPKLAYHAYAADADLLNAAGAAGCISAGGSVLTVGKKTDGSAWNVGITDPFGGSAPVQTLQVPGGMCVSTSGDYERAARVGETLYHHILDPGTGYPARTNAAGYTVSEDQRPVSVTVLCRDGLLADALSTACFVLGEEEGKGLAERFGAEVMYLYADGRFSR